MVADIARSPLAAWENFYIIVGSSAGALTGLQFVVMALASDATRRGTAATIAAFATPTVVHFSVALLVAAIACAPWVTVASPAIAMACCGAAGVLYVGLVTVRAHRQDVYVPVLEDWIWHVGLPFVAYGALLVASLLLPGGGAPVPFFVAGSVLLLVFVGIHNSWDSATYIAVDLKEK